MLLCLRCHTPSSSILKLKQAHSGKYLVMWCAALLEKYQSPAKQEILYIFVYNLHNIDK